MLKACPQPVVLLEDSRTFMRQSLWKDVRSLGLRIVGIPTLFFFSSLLLGSPDASSLHKAMWPKDYELELLTMNQNMIFFLRS